MQNGKPDTDELIENDSSNVPSGLDTDPNSDEEVIEAGEDYPQPTERPTEAAC